MILWQGYVYSQITLFTIGWCGFDLLFLAIGFVFLGGLVFVLWCFIYWEIKQMKLVIDHVWLNGNKHITSPFFVMMSIGQFLMNTNRVRLQTNRNYKIRKKNNIRDFPRMNRIHLNSRIKSCCVVFDHPKPLYLFHQLNLFGVNILWWQSAHDNRK